MVKAEDIILFTYNMPYNFYTSNCVGESYKYNYKIVSIGNISNIRHETTAFGRGNAVVLLL